MNDIANKESITGALWRIILHAESDGIIVINDCKKVISDLNNISGINYLDSANER